MRKAKTVSKSKDPSKRELVDALPGLKAAEIIANAKEKGINLSASYAYSLAAQRRKAASGGTVHKMGTNGARKAKARRKPQASAPSKASAPAIKSSGTVLQGEREFLALAADLGLRRSQELLGQLKSKFAAISAQ